MTLRTAPRKAFPLNKKGVLKEIDLSQPKKLLHLNVNKVNSRRNMFFNENPEDSFVSSSNV